MLVTRPFVEGPEFARRVQEAEKVVTNLAKNKWDFAAAAEAFAPTSMADVLAKEIVHIHDGERMTRVGYLVMGGVGEQFNLMGPIPAHSVFKIGGENLLDEVNRQLGTKGLQEIPKFRKLGKPQQVEFFNYSNFYQLRDLIHWLVLHGSGCFPSTLETMVRQFAAGNIVQNNMYRPIKPSHDRARPAIMQARCMGVSFSSSVVEWMDKPIFGGLSPETIHVEYLLTPKRSDVVHPYLKLDLERIVKLKIDSKTRNYYLKRFRGITPKDGLRDLQVPQEGKGF